MALLSVADLQGEGVVERLGHDLQPDRGRVRPEAAGGLVAAVGYNGTTAVMGGLLLGVALWCSRVRELRRSAAPADGLLSAGGSAP